MMERNGTAYPVVTYRGKVKLHGTNCAVQVNPEGVYAQRREGMLTAKSDWKGFAKWAETYAEEFKKVVRPAEGCTLFGEWAGEGVESGMAISSQKKIWAVFAIQDGYLEHARIVYDPAIIAQRLANLNVPNLYVLPWDSLEEFQVDYGDRASLERTADTVNRRVMEIEQEDPWVRNTFGVSGLGEGIVLYPVAVAGSASMDLYPEAYLLNMWKAKGAKHRNPNVNAAQTTPNVVADPTEFVNLMVTEARLLQGVTIAGDGKYEKRLTGRVVQWVGDDTEKESKAELAASGLTWAQVKGAVSTRAREWYLTRCP